MRGKCEKCAEYAGSDLMGLGNLFGMHFGADSILRQKKGEGKSCKQDIEQPPQIKEDKTSSKYEQETKAGRVRQESRLFLAPYFFASPLICLTLLARFHLPDFTRLASSAADFPCIF